MRRRPRRALPDLRRAARRGAEPHGLTRAIRPRVGSRLTTRPSFGPSSSFSPRSSRSGEDGLATEASSPRRFRPCARQVMATSDAPCRARRGSSPWGETSSRARIAFPASPSRATASTIQSAFHRFDAPRCVSAPRLAGARHQLRGFATDGAASSCRFALVARATRTRPESRHRFITGGRRRAGRLESTSADETIREHDHGRPSPARPRSRSPGRAATLVRTAFRPSP